MARGQQKGSPTTCTMSGIATQTENACPHALETTASRSSTYAFGMRKCYWNAGGLFYCLQGSKNFVDLKVVLGPVSTRTLLRSLSCRGPKIVSLRGPPGLAAGSVQVSQKLAVHSGACWHCSCRLPQVWRAPWQGTCRDCSCCLWSYHH